VQYSFDESSTICALQNPVPVNPANLVKLLHIDNRYAQSCFSRIWNFSCSSRHQKVHPLLNFQIIFPIPTKVGISKLDNGYPVFVMRMIHTYKQNVCIWVFSYMHPHKKKRNHSCQTFAILARVKIEKFIRKLSRWYTFWYWLEQEKISDPARAVSLD
jgi:hypothetical protein